MEVGIASFDDRVGGHGGGYLDGLVALMKTNSGEVLGVQLMVCEWKWVEGDEDGS